MSKIIKIEKIERCGQCKYYHEYYSPNIANGIGDRCEYPGYPSQQAWKEILPPDCPLPTGRALPNRQFDDLLSADYIDHEEKTKAVLNKLRSIGVEIEEEK